MIFLDIYFHICLYILEIVVMGFVCDVFFFWPLLPSKRNKCNLLKHRSFSLAFVKSLEGMTSLKGVLLVKKLEI